MTYIVLVVKERERGKVRDGKVEEDQSMANLDKFVGAALALAKKYNRVLLIEIALMRERHFEYAHHRYY